VLPSSFANVCFKKITNLDSKKYPV